jgi:large subunit ribosomal protein L4
MPKTSKKKSTKTSKKVASAAKSNLASSAKLSMDVYDVKGKVVGTIKLPEAIFGLKENQALVSQAVRVYLANQRTGTASTKTRGEVRGSTRKIYRQKGTGRARHGGIRAPIFVHGGIAHGPKPKDYGLSMPQKMRKKALFVALSSKVKDGDMKFVEGFGDIEPKTKHMAQTLSALFGKTLPKKTLLVLPDYAANITRAARNIKGLTYIASMQLNAYEAVKHTHIVFMKEAVDAMEKGSVKTA